MADSKVDVTLLNYYKDLYSGHKIIYVRFLDTDFIFRTLTRKEYKYIMQSESNQMDIEDSICNTCCIYPEDYEFKTCGFAGLNEYAADVIETVSGLRDIQHPLNEYRQIKEFSNLEIQCMDLIKAFIPEYTYEEMEEWTWSKLMYMTVRAEKVAELKGFDWHIQDMSEEYLEEMSKINSDNKEFLKELREAGIDPMYYFSDELQHSFKREILDFPLIGGVHWDNEEVLNVIRKQIAKKNNWSSKPNL
jgi:hypothetical protein